MLTWEFRYRHHFGNRSVSDAEQEFMRELEKPGEDERVIDESDLGYQLTVPETDPIPYKPVHDHRSGTSFEDESGDMRAQSITGLTQLLEADVVLHECRHNDGYHTDLVFADVDDEGLSEYRSIVAQTGALHDPLQRIKTWWYIYEHGPMHRSEAIQDGRYKDPKKNQEHVEDLLDMGLLGRTAADALVAVTPPEVADLHAVELKLRNWEKALEQAERANESHLGESHPWYDRYGYADYRWVALDATAIPKALEHRETFVDAGVGLIGVAEGGTVVKHVDAESDPRGRYTRDRAWIESEVRTELQGDIDDDEQVGEVNRDITQDHSNPSQPGLGAFSGAETQQ